jgi:hypothetical protein
MQIVPLQPNDEMMTTMMMVMMVMVMMVVMVIGIEISRCRSGHYDIYMIKLIVPSECSHQPAGSAARAWVD